MLPGRLKGFAAALASLAAVGTPGCLDGFAALEEAVPRPMLALGTWWVVHTEEWAGGDPPWRVRDETYWVVGVRDVGGAPWPVAMVIEAAAPPPFPAGPFRLVLLPPGRPEAVGGMPSEVSPGTDVAQVVECRGVESCPTGSLAPGNGRPPHALPFPLLDDYRLSSAADGRFAERFYQTFTGHVVGHGTRPYAFGKADVVRIEERVEYRGFEHRGRADVRIDYAPGLGLIVRERADECALPVAGSCSGTSGRSLDVSAHGWLAPPSMAEVGQRFAVQQAGLVHGQAIDLAGNRANVALGEAVAARATFMGLRPADTVELRFTPQGEPGNATTVVGASGSYVPVKPGWYDLDAIARAPQGVPVGLSHGEFRTIHDGVQTVMCGSTCPAVAVPMGPAVQNVAVTAHMDSLLPSGRLDVRDGTGRLQGTCACPEVTLGVLAPQARDWTAQWTPGFPGAGGTVSLRVMVE